jgi:hypothetical protein
MKVRIVEGGGRILLGDNTGGEAVMIDPLVFSVLEFVFKMVPLVYTTYIYSSLSSELCKTGLNLDLPESDSFLSRRESTLII